MSRFNNGYNNVNPYDHNNEQQYENNQYGNNQYGNNQYDTSMYNYNEPYNEPNFYNNNYYENNNGYEENCDNKVYQSVNGRLHHYKTILKTFSIPIGIFIFIIAFNFILFPNRADIFLYAIEGVILLVIGSIITSVRRNKICRNAASVVKHEQHLYYVLDENPFVVLVLISQLFLGMYGLIFFVLVFLSYEERKRGNAALLATNEYFTFACTRKTCHKILKVYNITNRRGIYKISCLVENGKTKRQSRKTIYLENGINDLDELINTIKYYQ